MNAPWHMADAAVVIDGAAEPASGSGKGTGLYRWDPRLKLLMLLLAVGLNVGFARLWLSCALTLVGIALLMGSRVPASRFLFFLIAPAWATLVVFIGFSVGFGETPLAAVGPLTLYREGVVLGTAAAARVACDMIWLAAFFLTTAFDRVLAVLKWCRIPEVLVDTMAMTYRYAFLLVAEFSRMREAARARGGMNGYRTSIRSTALILTQMILRAYDRSKSVMEAMINRGAFSGTAERPAGASPDGDACPNQCDITPEATPPAQPVLQLRNVSYFHGRSRSIKDISLAVHRGEVLVLCGPNGAGKTTLLRLAAGSLVPEGGWIRIGEKRLDRRTRKAAFRLVGFLAQDPNDQLFCTHVREDIAFGPTQLGLSPAEVRHRVDTAMDLMEVAHLARRPIHMLSFGEMKRVGLAGIIAMQPPLILMDEPTAGLDPASAEHLVRLIRHLNDHHGYTLVLVTHDINMAARIAKRIVIMDDGRIRADGEAGDILQEETLLERSRLEPPILTRLFKTMQRRGVCPALRIPTNVEAAAEYLTAVIDADGRRNGGPIVSPSTGFTHAKISAGKRRG